MMDIGNKSFMLSGFSIDAQQDRIFTNYVLPSILLHLNGKQVNMVHNFIYLGSIVSHTNPTHQTVKLVSKYKLPWLRIRSS